MHGAKTMLGVVGKHGEVEVGKSKTLEHFGSRAKEGNRTAAATQVSWFAGLGDGDDYGFFPDVWNLRV